MRGGGHGMRATLDAHITERENDDDCPLSLFFFFFCNPEILNGNRKRHLNKNRWNL